MNRNSHGRKSKEVCKQLLHTSLTVEYISDIEDYELSEYDSDDDPEFKYYNECDSEEDEDEVDDNKSDSESSENNNSDSGDSIFSNATQYNNVRDLIQKVINNNESIPCKLTEMDDFDDFKQLSKRKISEQCNHLLSMAQDNVFHENYDKAMEQCNQILKEYPSFWGTYYVLAQIQQNKGDVLRANQLYYTAAMCNPRDANRWIECIEITKDSEGIDKAIKITKSALTRTNNASIRELYVQLLEEGGYVKESLKKKIDNIKLAPPATDPKAIEDEVMQLFGLSKQFEEMKDLKRSTKCLEIINSKYPQHLTDEHRINLLKSMVSVNMLNGVVNVVGRMEGVDIDLNRIGSFLTFSEGVSDDYRRQVIIATIYAAIHSRLTIFITDASFVEFVRELVHYREEYLTIVNRLFKLSYYGQVLNLTRFFADNNDDKLSCLKIYGKCQEALGHDTEALETYDYIISEINEQDASIWELKANLLYRLQREEEAIQVLAESQRFINETRANGDDFEDLSMRCKPTKESLQLLYRLCKLLYQEKRFDHFIKVAWKFLFIDSYEYFEVNKIRMCLEDIERVRPRTNDVQNNIWLCISKTMDSKGHCSFQSSHSRTPDDSTWNVFQDLLALLAQDKDNCHLIEVLAQWGLVLHKIMNWDFNRRLDLSSIYVTSALRNRIVNHSLRLEVSSKMIFQELRILSKRFGDKNQFWNLFQICAHVLGTVNIRAIVRGLPQAKNSLPLEMINAGFVLTSSAKLALAINGKLYSNNRTNPQISLHMAIILLNSALSRNCRERIEPLKLAIGFLNEYRRYRGECQETYFNMGRFFHRLGRNYEHLAIAWYDKCLALPPVGNTDDERKLNDLSKEAAFNLVLLYKSRNSFDMARYLTQKYLVLK